MRHTQRPMPTGPAAHDDLAEARVSCCGECGVPLGLDEPNGAGDAHATAELSGEPAAAGTSLLGGVSPSLAAVAVIALLAFGVLVGSAVSPTEESSAVARAPIIVEVSPSSTPSSAPSAGTPPPAAAAEASPPETAAAAATPESTTPTATTPSTPTKS